MPPKASLSALKRSLNLRVCIIGYSWTIPKDQARSIRKRRSKLRNHHLHLREYNLKYLGLGNVFHTKDIEAAILKGRKFKDSLNSNTSEVCRSRPWFWFICIWCLHY